MIDVAGRARAAEGTGGMVTWRAITPEYFAALGIPIVRGRGFEEEGTQVPAVFTFSIPLSATAHISAKA